MLSYSDMPGFSKIFSELCSNSDIASTVFSSNKKVEDINWRNAIINKQQYANYTVEIIRKTMHHVELTELQQHNLLLLEQKKAGIIITGQQVGFLGGPLYSILKACSAISAATQYSEDACKIIPMFWIEDNDHDALEAGSISILQADHNIQDIAISHHILSNSHKAVADLHIDAGVDEILEQISQTLPDSLYKDDLMQELRSIYTSGMGWTSAFVSFMQNRLGHYGLLFFSASEARKTGIFADIISHECKHPGHLKTIVEHQNAVLKEYGIDAQANASEINVFFHKDNNRMKIHMPNQSKNEVDIGDLCLSIDELQNYLFVHQDSCSPSVLLRPIVQDAILPVIATIVGPGEAGYMAQLDPVYKEFGIERSAILPRHSLYCITPSLERFFEKNSLNSSFFMKSWNDIEYALMTRYFSDDQESLMFDSIHSSIAEHIERLNQYVEGIDKNLIGSVAAAEHAIEKQIDIIRKKVVSSKKKQNELLFQKGKEAMNWIYPKGKHQERVISSISFENKIGSKAFISAIMDIASQKPDQQYKVALKLNDVNV